MSPSQDGESSERSGRDAKVEADAASVRHHSILDSLIVAVAEAELGVDVRDIRPEAEVASDERDVHALRVEARRPPLRQVEADANLAELDVAAVVDVRLHVLEQRLEVDLGRDVLRVWLTAAHADVLTVGRDVRIGSAGGAIDALHDDTRLVPIDFAAL